MLCNETHEQCLFQCYDVLIIEYDVIVKEMKYAWIIVDNKSQKHDKFQSSQHQGKPCVFELSPWIRYNSTPTMRRLGYTKCCEHWVHLLADLCHTRRRNTLGTARQPLALPQLYNVLCDPISARLSVRAVKETHLKQEPHSPLYRWAFGNCFHALEVGIHVTRRLACIEHLSDGGE
jgi:hypothetical protein